MSEPEGEFELSWGPFHLVRQRKYEEKVKKLDGRTSYTFADQDVTSIRMKEDRGAEKPWSKPAYNVQWVPKTNLWSASACTREPEIPAA